MSDLFFDLKGKVAFITGGAKGIGRAVTTRFLKAGARVAIMDLQGEDSILPGTEDFRENHISFKGDVTSIQDWERALQIVKDNWGLVDIIVNNAGISNLTGTVEEGDPEQWRKTFEVNVFGVMKGLKTSPAFMKDGGTIINTSSQSAKTKMMGLEPYSASKEAVISLTRSAAIELSGRNIRVNAICPTNTRTPMMMESADADYSEQMTRVFCPMGRVAETGDLEGVYHFLASAEAGFINGQAIYVDGGWTAGISLQAMEKSIS